MDTSLVLESIGAIGQYFLLTPNIAELPPSITLQVVAKFRYLGEEVQQPVESYAINNISQLIQRLKHTLVAWTKLPLNLLGRIKIFKMIYLP